MQQVLEGRHDQFGCGGKGHVEQLPGRCRDLSIHPRSDPAAAVIVQLPPPAERCWIVVGPCVNHPAVALGVFRQVGVVALSVESELQNLHPRQLELITQRFDICGDHTKILCDQWKGAAVVPSQTFEEGAPGRGLPAPVFGGAVPSGNCPVGA